MKVVRKVIIEAICIVAATAVALAWYTYVYKGSATITNVSPATPATSDLQLSETSSGYSTDVSLTSNYALYPCAKGSGMTLKNDIGNIVTSNAEYVVLRTVNIKSPSGSLLLKVSGIEVTGDGKDDEITKSIRIAIDYGGTTTVYAPLREPDYTQTVGVVTTSSIPMTIYLWYEGTDEANTSSNALASSGSISVKLNFTTTEE